MNPPTFPARPINGGPFTSALPKSGAWFYEPKYNGWRALVHVATGAMFNRKLEPLSIAAEFKPALAKLRATFDCSLGWTLTQQLWADCEALERRHGLGRGTLIVLDLIDPALAQMPYTERRQCLVDKLPALHAGNRPDNDSVYRSPALGALGDNYGGDLPLKAWNELQQFNTKLGCDFYEGLVAKRADSIYPIQLRKPEAEFPFWVKHRWHW